MNKIMTIENWWREPLQSNQEVYCQDNHAALQVSQLGMSNPVVTQPYQLCYDSFLIIDIEILLSIEKFNDYRYCKIYFAKADRNFYEDKSLLFQLEKTADRQIFLLQLPDDIRRDQFYHFMVDPIPFFPQESYRLHGVTVGNADDVRHWLKEYDQQITRQAIQIAGAMKMKSVANGLVSLLARKLRTGSFEIDYSLTNLIIRTLVDIDDDESLRNMINRLDVHNYHYSWGSLIKETGRGLIAGNQNGEDHHILLGQYRQCAYVELDLSIETDWLNTRNYEFSKLYFDLGGKDDYSEESVVCFRVKCSGQREKVVIRLPYVLATGEIMSLRLDPLPTCTRGRFSVFGCRVLNDGELDLELQKQADLDYLKQQTRKAVIESEDQQVSPIAHLPESMSLELTPRCDFTCAHCSSHGTKELHDEYNRMPIFVEDKLDKLAVEVFPALSTLTIVGRGEPSIVPERYWQKLMSHLRVNRTRFTMVTHGYHLQRRITEENIDLVDTITISIDGITQETFAKNRGGKELERVLENAAYYHQLRQKSRLMKRPRLCFSWTLLKNNIHEFPDFVRYVARFEPEMLYVRHLLVYHSKDMHESLFDQPELANQYLREAYKIMEQHGIRGDCPPLFNTVDIELSKHNISKLTDGHFQPIRGKQIDETVPVILGSFQKTNAMYARVDLSISLDVDAIQQYSRSKLYYDLENRRQFTEDNVVAFQVQKSNSKESVLIRLPFALAEKQIISLRLDPLPDCHNSNFEIFSFSLLREDELTIDEKNRADHDYQKKQRHKKWMEGLRNKTRLTGMCLEVTLDQPVELEVHTSDLEEVELTGKPTAQSLETAVLETGIVADHVRNMDYKCVYMHRTGVVLSNGEVNTCAAPYVKTVGSLQNQSFGEIWLGKDMQNIRQDIGTVKEWKQCKNCWFREINYRNQRRERHSGRVFDYSEGSQYTLDAWDFRGYEGRTDIIAKN